MTHSFSLKRNVSDDSAEERSDPEIIRKDYL